MSLRGWRHPLLSRLETSLGRLLSQGPLGRQMLITICSLFLVVMLVSQMAIVHLFAVDAFQRVDQQASLIMTTMKGVRDYTAREIDPIVSPLNQDSEVFRPQVMPSYAAQAIFDLVSSSPSYERYHYKEAALNPTNPEDLASAQERQIIQRFLADPSLRKVSGRLRLDGHLAHYVAEPLRVSSASCLVCHSTPERAPASLVSHYGRDHGFGWKLNELIGIQIVSVPITIIERSLRQTVLAVTLALLVGLLVLGLLTSALLDRILLAPMRHVSQKANEASLDPTLVQFGERRRRDEIGELASSLERMRQSLLIAMRMLKG